MSISLVQVQELTNDGQSHTLTMDSAPTDGNLLLLINGSGASLTSVPAGWTERRAHTDGALQIYSKIASSETTSQGPFSLASANQHGSLVMEFSSTVGWPTNDGYDDGSENASQSNLTSYVVNTGRSGSGSGDHVMITMMRLRDAYNGGAGSQAEVTGFGWDNSFSLFAGVTDISTNITATDGGSLEWRAGYRIYTTAPSSVSVTASWTNDVANQRDVRGQAVIFKEGTPPASGDYGKIIDLAARQRIREVR